MGSVVTSSVPPKNCFEAPAIIPVGLAFLDPPVA